MEIQRRKLLSKRDLYEMLDVSLGTVNNMIKENRIPYYKIGKSVRFNYEEINNFLKECKV
jgi:excisionase family DNA binding protein